MKHATSRMLFSYWDGLRGERAAPERGDIEPGAIRHILADTFVLTAANQGSAASFRLAGTRCSALFGRDLKGQSVATLWCLAQRREIDRQIGGVLADTAGIVAGVRGQAENGWTIDLEFLLLPLKHHGRTDERALGSLSAATLPSWLGLIPVVTLETTTLRIVNIVRELRTESVGDPASTRRARFVVHEGGRR